jgi:hypothetical protein
MTNCNVMDKENKNNLSPDAAGGEQRKQQRPRRRRVEPDLRRRVLRDQTCKQLLFDASLSVADEQQPAGGGEKLPPDAPRAAGDSAPPEQPPPRKWLTCAEKVTQVRRKLEKIVHRRESNNSEAKALGYLATLDKMTISQQVPLQNAGVEFVSFALYLNCWFRLRRNRKFASFLRSRTILMRLWMRLLPVFSGLLTASAKFKKN